MLSAASRTWASGLRGRSGSGRGRMRNGARGAAGMRPRFLDDASAGFVVHQQQKPKTLRLM
ncbi:hypothetical protein BN1708_015113 [Verticillium longisporum]|uniref:Uncharacterized protein n=1 Tax=Verticillium longisporum TaxID=100787 RepID=A0A0G4M1R3_VERLO|nr:hypothetical protein BN1708_015113 [Verticillium longisporum]